MEPPPPDDRDAIHAAWTQGAEAWPAVAVALERFAAHVRSLGAPDLARHGADLYLACACVDGDPRALAAFDAEVLTPAALAVRTIDASDAFGDEVRQRVRATLLVDGAGGPRLATYGGRGPLRAWVGVSAVRTALMMRRSAKRQREVPDDDWTGALVMASTGNPELDLLKRQYAAAFATALADACAGLEPRLRGALRMHFADGLSIDEIGAAYGVHRATAARWVQRAQTELGAATHALLLARLAISPSEADRVAALVHSQLDVSLSQLLA
ncbi:MAG: helix-turn-helix domain-containing protein [Deltaproteobacteria bacterium]|nr:helix-turn-helix domain-containing protein [Deltaproteobacteria bacterium]